MKKTYRLEDLECANCAAKMEQAIGKLDGVTAVNINFMQQRMILEADDARYDDILKKAQKAMRKIEPDVRVVL
ncbi:MAG: heavy-metal-associated domain-containing protein [Ruminococcaceae bacterium]|nr:heavy-metal-associated domain-containing protein [Oscillospiraceae bacterium]